jgi:hypothetical protein
MLRGKKTKSHAVASGTTLSGHMDDWQELAVGYVDSLLDQSSEGAVRDHLETCPDCARRLAAQQGALKLLRQTALAEAPAELEDKVLSEVLASRGSAPAAEASRSARRRQPQRRPRTWLSTTRPWVPATVAAVALLAVAVALGITSQPNLSQEGLATGEAASSADAAVAAADTESSTGGARNSSTTAPALLGMSGSAPVSTETAAVFTTPGLSASSASMRPSGPYLKTRGAMVSGLTQASAPGYFFFGIEGEGFLTAQQADSVASRVTTATGLQLMRQDLSSDMRAFAAFVAREDASAVVDLLCSIGASLQLTVSLSLQPGSAVTAWSESLLQSQYDVAQLYASPSQPPATAGWSYTTSTSPTTLEDAQAPKAPPLDEAAARVLVVILVNVKM